MNAVDDFIRGVFGDGKVTRHAVSNGRGRILSFTLCGQGGWCAEDADATCSDCRAILDGRAEAWEAPDFGLYASSEKVRAAEAIAARWFGGAR